MIVGTTRITMDETTNVIQPAKRLGTVVTMAYSPPALGTSVPSSE